MEALNKLKDLILQAEQEGEKFYNKGNKAAGTRLRGIMQEVKVTANEVRVSVLEKKAEPKA